MCVADEKKEETVAEKERVRENERTLERKADGRVSEETRKYCSSGFWKMDVEREQITETSRSILSTEILRVFIRTNTIMKFHPAIPSSLLSVRKMSLFLRSVRE